MARREDIDNAIWADPTFEGLSSDAKLLYLWSFTNPFCNMAGLYKVSPARMRQETGLSAPRKRKAFVELEQARLVAREGEYIWVRARVKYLRTRSPAMAASIVADVVQLPPDHPLRARFVQEYLTWPWLVEKGGAGWRGLCDATSGVTSGVTRESPYVSQNTGGSVEGLQTLKGNGNGNSSSLRTTETTKDSQLHGDFEEWLEHHEQTTGMRQPREGTKGRQHILTMFAARRYEGHELDDLKLATVGAFRDEHRREHGYYDHESVLRPTKVGKLVELGRRAQPKPRSERHAKVVHLGDVLSCRRCDVAISNYQANNQSGMCDGCYEQHVQKLTGEVA